MVANNITGRRWEMLKLSPESSRLNEHHCSHLLLWQISLFLIPVLPLKDQDLNAYRLRMKRWPLRGTLMNLFVHSSKWIQVLTYETISPETLRIAGWVTESVVLEVLRIRGRALSYLFTVTGLCVDWGTHSSAVSRLQRTLQLLEMAEIPPRLVSCYYTKLCAFWLGVWSSVGIGLIGFSEKDSKLRHHEVHHL